MSQNKVKFHWPENKRIAVCATVMLEVWSDGKAPQYSTQTSNLKPNQVAYSNITWSHYGAYSGAWRLMRTLSDFGMRGTFATNARAAELFPDTVKQIVKSGHDIAAHGITQDQPLIDLSPEDEQATIRKCIDTFHELTGKRPEGWISPVLAWTPQTQDFLVKEKLRWYGDVNYVDQPRRLTTKSGSIIGIPVTEFSDLRVLRSSPRDFVDFYRDTFDYLYRHEPGSLITFVTHCHWGGRAGLVAVLRQVLEYFKQFPDVWFTSHGEIASWVEKLGVDGESYGQRFFGAEQPMKFVPPASL
jgi:allantoinase